MKTLQVLVATMGQDPLELCQKMNIGSDAIIINQCDKFSYSKLSYNNSLIEYYCFKDRGLSKSRNNALMRATADIICIADDDIVYTDTYKKDVVEEFEKHPEADVLIFNVSSFGGERESVNIKKYEKLKRFEYKEFGSVHIAMRREKLLYSNTWFNVMFGSGSLINSGEDTIFLNDLLKKGFRIYKSPLKIAEVDMSNSSWFRGYNEKYFKNKGALVAAIYPKMWLPGIVLLSLKNSKSKLGSYTRFFELFKWYYSGVSEFKKLQ